MKKILIKVIKLYQGAPSLFLGKNCRFYPSCSQYAVDSLNKHGFFKGLIFSFLRILKCNPFHKGGVDILK